ncbi:MAG: nucleotidyltransferase domain-containing protein [Bacteroidota bacterium]
MVEEKIKYSKEELKKFCIRNHIKKLSFFGSVLTDKFTDDSDVDLLIEFIPGKIPGLFRLAEMEIELSDMIGRKVDLRTIEDLSKYFRNDVIAKARIEYVR